VTTVILDTLENASQYVALNKKLKPCFDFLMRDDLQQLPEGRHEIDGDRLYAVLSKGPGRRRKDGMLEAHTRYIDVQVILEGTDEMGWKPLSSCKQPSGGYDGDRDIAFFQDQPDSWIVTRPGQFVIFFPEDAHLPSVSDGVIHKVVVKIAVD
jgi:biofilm protein TabA